MMDKENMKVEAIKHGKSRVATFKKRRTSLLKKAHEFTILCGVQLCCIIYGPKLKDMPSRPETWASGEGDLTNIINRYKDTVGRDVRAQRASSSSSSHENLAEEVDDEEIAKIGRIKGSEKFFTWDPRFDDFSEDHLGFILSKVVTKLNVAKKKLEKMRKSENVVREDGCMQKYLKNDKVKARIDKKFPSCNKNGSPFDGTCNCMAIVQCTQSNVGRALHIGEPSYNAQTHWMPKNMVINNSNPQMQTMPQQTNNHESNRHAGQVNLPFNNISKSPQKE